MEAVGQNHHGFCMLTSEMFTYFVVSPRLPEKIFLEDRTEKYYRKRRDKKKRLQEQIYWPFYIPNRSQGTFDSPWHQLYKTSPFHQGCKWHFFPCLMSISVTFLLLWKIAMPRHLIGESLFGLMVSEGWESIMLGKHVRKAASLDGSRKMNVNIFKPKPEKTEWTENRMRL